MQSHANLDQLGFGLLQSLYHQVGLSCNQLEALKVHLLRLVGLLLSSDLDTLSTVVCWLLCISS